METAEMPFLREAAVYKMADHKRNEHIGEELGGTGISTIITVKTSDLNNGKEYMKSESQSCHISIKRREVDAWNVPQKNERYSFIQVEVFWVVTPCSVVVGHQRFRGPLCFHL
jgi:hypothetical protein